MKRFLLSVLFLLPLVAQAGGDWGPPTCILVPYLAAHALVPEPQMDWGFDLRVRAVGTNNLPQPDHLEEPRVEYLRIRSKLWGKLENDDREFYLRLGNEPFYFRTPGMLKGMRRFPDVVFIDNLYYTFKDLFGGNVDLKIGRQDIWDLGSERIMLDGTPGDGSRSFYYDAVRLTLKFEENRTLDLLGIYNTNHDWMPSLGNDHPDPKPYKSRDFDTNGVDQDEWALALYWKDRSSKTLPWDLYYFFKGEERGSRYTRSFIPSDRDHFYTQTLGFRLQPKLSETLSADIEAALQWGDEQHLAAMGYGALHWTPWTKAECRFEPRFSAACFYLSGDSDGPRGKHAWMSLFNRASFIGDVPGGMYDKYDHTNLLYPHLTIKFTPAENMAFSTSFGPMFAPAEERYNGQRYGHDRGFFANIYYEIAVGQYTDVDWFQPFTISFLGEVMTKGNWFEDENEQGLGFYGQLDFTWSF